MDALWALPEQQQWEMCELISYNLATEAQNDIKAATPPQLLVPYMNLTYQQKLVYMTHVQKGCQESLRVLDTTKDTFLVLCQQEMASRAEREREQAHQKGSSTISPPGVLVQSRSQEADGKREQAHERSSTIPTPGPLVRSQNHLAQATTEDIGLGPIKDSGSIGALVDEEPEKSAVVTSEREKAEDLELILMVERRSGAQQEEMVETEQAEESKATSPFQPLPPPPAQPGGEDRGGPVQEQQELVSTEKSQQQQQQQQQQPTAPPTPRPPPKLQALPAGLGAPIGRADSSETFGVRDDGERGEEELSKRTGIGTGYMVSVLVGCGKEPDGRRMTINRPRRERLREKEKTTADRESILLERHVLFLICDLATCPYSFWFGLGWMSWCV